MKAESVEESPSKDEEEKEEEQEEEEEESSESDKKADVDSCVTLTIPAPKEPVSSLLIVNYYIDGKLLCKNLVIPFNNYLFIS